MTKQAIDRLGMLCYGTLIWGIANGMIQRGLSEETRDSLPILIPRIVVSLVGVTALFFCLFCLIRHLIVENTQVGMGGKVLWLVLLLFLSAFAMPVYWYVYMVRDRLMDEHGASVIENAPPAMGAA